MAFIRPHRPEKIPTLTRFRFVTRLSGLALFALGALLSASVHAQDHNESSTALAARVLQGGNLAEGETLLGARIEAHADDRDARFGLGLLHFARAVERLGQGLYRHGLSPWSNRFVPFVRLPVPYNPRPEPITYEAFRNLLQNFLDDLAKAEATLGTVGPTGSKITFDLNRVNLDFNGDGSPDEKERLGVFFETMQSPSPAGPGRADFIVALDHADVLWLRGYCHRLAAMGEFWLAHDWRTAFDATFHMFFPDSVATDLIPPPQDRYRQRENADQREIADLVAFVHLIRWPVAEHERLLRVREHLKSVTALSRENWRAILAETDDDHEWLPSPRQDDVAIRALRVTQERIDTWLAALDDFDAVLDGRKLVPHWRWPSGKGINLKKVFEEPRRFDLVLWITGQAALPYIADGETISETTWGQWRRVFGGDFFAYAVWFN